MKIVVETQFGPIETVELPPAPAAKLKNVITSQFSKITHLTLDTSAGAVLIPKATLDRSVIRFVGWPAPKKRGGSKSKAELK